MVVCDGNAEDREVPETLCVPSEAIEYRDTLAKPSGNNIVP